MTIMDGNIAIMPESSIDMCKEAISQGNCLMEYLEDHASGETTILFIRRSENPSLSFVTMEVKDWIVKQVYGKYNSIPSREVLEFLKEYSRTHWILFDPYEIVSGYAENEEYFCDFDEDVFEYAQEYHERNHIEEYPEEDEYVQMTIAECFPAAFGGN